MKLPSSPRTIEPIRVVVTNDDGPKSPLTLNLIASLKRQPWCKSLLPVLPAQEQSWVADAVTRFRPLHSTAHDFMGTPGFLIDGTPADCASIGLNNLSNTLPDLLVSGINFGNNAGLAFFLSSGTVGATTQGFLNGFKAVALSLSVTSEIYGLWGRKAPLELAQRDADWQRVAGVAVNIIEKLIAADAWESADLISVNLPWSVQDSTPIKVTALKPVIYKPLFASAGDAKFQHTFQGFQELDRNEAVGLELDLDVLDENMISVTPVRFNLSPADLIAGLAQTLER